MTSSRDRGSPDAEPVAISESDAVLLIRINRLYRHTMSPVELYDATRGTWKLGSRRENARFALAVFEGVVREVYQIDTWHPAGITLPYGLRAQEHVPTEDRCEFRGSLAPDDVRQRYVDRSVAHYFAQGAQFPVRYVNGPPLRGPVGRRRRATGGTLRDI